MKLPTPSIRSFHTPLPLFLFTFLSILTPQATATLTFGPILQCSPVSVAFTPPSTALDTSSGGSASLTILPLGLPPVVFPFSPRLTGQENAERRSIILTALPFPAGTQFVASLTNQRGNPLSLTSPLLSIRPPDSSSSANTNTSSCLTSPRPPTRSFALLSNPAQCQDFTVWYNATAFNSSGVPTVPRVRVYAPGGVELLLNNTANSVGVLPEGVTLEGTVTEEDGFAKYRMGVGEGREVVLMFDGGNGVREVTDLITVSPSTSTDCLQAERDALAALTPTSDPNAVRPSRAIIIGAATGGGAVLLIALAMTFFILRDKRHRAAQKQRRARVIRRVRSMSESMFGFGGGNGGAGGMRGDTFMFPRRIRSASYPGPSSEGSGTDEKDKEGGGGGGGQQQLSYANHPYAAFDRGSSAASMKSYVVIDRPNAPPRVSSPSQPPEAKPTRPTSLSQIQRDGPYQPRPSLGAQSAETREISPLRFSRYGYGENDPDRLSLTSLDIEGMLNMAAVQEDSGRSREGSVPGLQGKIPVAEGVRGDSRPRLESRMSSENVVPRVLLSGSSSDGNNSEQGGQGIPQVNLPTPPPDPTPPRPPPVIVRTRSRRTLKVNSDIPDGAFSGTNSFVSSYSVATGGEGDIGDAESMSGWSPVYPSAYFRSSAYPQPGLSPGSEAALRVMAPPRLEELRQESYGSSSLVSSSEESSLTKGIIPFPDGRQDEYPERQPALASSSSVLPKPQSQSQSNDSPRKESSDSNSSSGGQNASGPLQRTSSMRDSSSSYAIPSPSAFPDPPSSIPKVQYPYRPTASSTAPLRPRGGSTLRSLPPVTTSFTRAPPSSASSSQPSAALSSGVTYSTGIATSGSSKASAYPALSPSGITGGGGGTNSFGGQSPSSFPTLPAYSPLRDPPPFSALSPPSDSVLSSLWPGRPALSPLMEQSDSPVSSTSAGSRQALLPPLSTSNLSRQGQLGSSLRSPLSQSSGSSQLPSPASVRIASKGDVVTMARRTPGGGSLPVNIVVPQRQGQGQGQEERSQLRRGGSVSTTGTVSRQPSTIGEEYYGIAR